MSNISHMTAKEKEDHNLTFQIQNLFQTTTRNIGVFTSIALVLLGSSRFYRYKKGFELYNVGFLGLSIMFGIVALIYSVFLLIDHKTYMNAVSKDIRPILEKWYIIPRLAVVADTIILLGSLYILFTSDFGKRVASLF